MFDGYVPLIFIRGEGDICRTPDGERVLAVTRVSAYDFDEIGNGYPISRDALEVCCGWDVTAVHIYESDSGEYHVLPIAAYLDSEFYSVFELEYATAPLYAEMKKR
jgi:hypothetical protein